MNDINLLPSRKKRKIENDTTETTLQIVSASALGIIIVLSVTLFLLTRFNGLDTLSQSQNDALSSLTLLHDKTAKILLVHDRLASIQTILNKRSSMETSINNIIQGSPSDISFDQFSIANKQLTMTATSPSLQSLDALNTTITNMVTQKKMRSYTINSFGLDQLSGKFSLVITAQL